MKPADIASLVQKVKSLQRDYPDVRNRWTEHCGTYSKGVKDPYRHDEASLRFFLNLHSLSSGNCDGCNPSDFNYCGGCGSRLR